MAKLEYSNQACDRCRQCVHYKNFPKYSCKVCMYAFSSNFRLDKQYDYKYQRKIEKRKQIQKSDTRLVALYTKIKEKYFNGNYVPEAEFVTFEWKRGQFSRGGWCRKSTKTMRIGKRYQICFNNTDDGKSWRKSFVCLMIHEMLHLRLPHHRKHFKNREAEITALVKDEHLNELFEGGENGSVQSVQG